MRAWLHDVRYAWRMFLRWPTLSLVAVLTIAVGVGANTVIFSFADLLWLRPMSVPEPDRVVRVYTSRVTAQGEFPRGDSSFPDYLDIRSQASALSGLATLERRGALLDTGTELRSVLASVVSDDFFTTLRVEPALGRAFTPADAEAQLPAVVISHGFWKRQYNGDPRMVGKTIKITGQEVTLLGVLPREFRSSDPLLIADLMVPLSTWHLMNPGDRQRLEQRDRRTFELYGRLAPGADLRSAQAELEVVSSRLAQTHPASNARAKFRVEPESAARDNYAQMGAMFIGVGLLVLVIAAANVAGLLIARAEHRQKEFATRLALGSPPARLVRQLVIESLMLALVGGGAAVLLATYLLDLLPALLPASRLRLDVNAVLDLRALAFTAATLLVAIFTFGLLPALQASRVNLIPVLRGVAGGNRRRFPLRSAIVVAQIAVAVVTVTCAGLLMRTVLKAQQIDPGFDADREAVIVEAVPSFARETLPQLRDYMDQVRARVGALPGVTGTAYALRVPFGSSGGGRTTKIASPHNLDDTVPVSMTMVSDGYFETLGTVLLRGRGFTSADISAARKVAVINDALRRRFFPAGEAVGQRLRIGERGDEYEVVGVAQTGKYNLLTEPDRAFIFLPLTDELWDFVLIASTSTDAGGMLEPVRRQLREVDRNVPITRSTTLRAHVSAELYYQRLAARLVAGLGGLGMALAAIGVYGLLASVVARRTREIGIRVALGAARARIFRLMLASALRLTAVGVAIGLLAGWFAARLLQSLLVGVSPADPLSYAAAALVLLTAALVAAIIPARRATQLDAMEALRYE